MCGRRSQKGVQCAPVHYFRSEFWAEFGTEMELNMHRTLLLCAPQPPRRYVNRLHWEPLTLSCHANWMQETLIQFAIVWTRPKVNLSKEYSAFRLTKQHCHGQLFIIDGDACKSDVIYQCCTPWLSFGFNRNWPRTSIKTGKIVFTPLHKGFKIRRPVWQPEN